jgi:creatinine amidohydrolase
VDQFIKVLFLKGRCGVGVNKSLRSVLIGELAWPDVKEFLKEHDTVVLPIGACEQHGPSCPIDTDARYASYISVKAAERARCALVAPTIPYGMSEWHMGFPGTITLTSHTLEQIVYEVVRSLARHGFKKIVVYNAHGGNGNDPAIINAMHRIRVDTGVLLVLARGHDRGIPAAYKREAAPPDIHGGESTISGLLVVSPQLVVSERIKKPNLTLPKSKYLRNAIGSSQTDGPYAIWSYALEDLTDTGALGEPSLASKEKGLKMIERSVNALAELIIEMDQIKLEELWPGRSEYLGERNLRQEK